MSTNIDTLQNSENMSLYKDNLNWTFSVIDSARCDMCGYKSPKKSATSRKKKMGIFPYIGLIYGRYLQ